MFARYILSPLLTPLPAAPQFHSPGGEDHVGCLALNRLCVDPSSPGQGERHSPLAEVMASRFSKELLDCHENMHEKERTGPMIATGRSR